MTKISRKSYALLLVIFMAVGCGNSGDQQSAGSAIEGLFGPSEKEIANSKERDAQNQKLQNQAEQLQKDRIESYK